MADGTNIKSAVARVFTWIQQNGADDVKKEARERRLTRPVDPEQGIVVHSSDEEDEDEEVTVQSFSMSYYGNEKAVPDDDDDDTTSDSTESEYSSSFSSTHTSDEEDTDDRASSTLGGGSAQDGVESDYEEDFVRKHAYLHDSKVDESYTKWLKITTERLTQHFRLKPPSAISIDDIVAHSELVREKLALGFGVGARSLDYVEDAFFPQAAECVFWESLDRHEFAVHLEFEMEELLSGRILQQPMFPTNAIHGVASEFWPQEIRVKSMSSNFDGSLRVSVGSHGAYRVFQQKLTERRKVERARTFGASDSTSDPIRQIVHQSANNDLLPASRGQHLLLHNQWRTDTWAALLAGRSAKDLEQFIEYPQHLKAHHKCLFQKNVLTLLMMDTIISGIMDIPRDLYDHAVRANFASDFAHYEWDADALVDTLDYIATCTELMTLQDAQLNVSVFGDPNVSKCARDEKFFLDIQLSITGRFERSASLAATLLSERRPDEYNGVSTILDVELAGTHQSIGPNANNSTVIVPDLALAEKID